MISELEPHEEISLFPLQTALFPGNKLPLRIFEPRYVDLIGNCMREQKRFGIVAIEKGQEARDIPQIFSVGTDAEIIDFDQGRDGLLNIVVEGRERFAIKSTRTQEDNLLTATVSYLPTLTEPSKPVNCQQLEAIFAQLSMHPGLADRITQTSGQLEMAFQVIPWLPIAQATKVELLAAETGVELLLSLETHLEKISKKNRS
jgi:Lon protease-like protein